MENVIIDKKLDSYSVNTNNFKTEHDIMVTITLDEYRSLVAENAKTDAKVSEVESKNWKLKGEIQDLKQTFEELKQRCEEES